jgi:hypothetical protein
MMTDEYIIEKGYKEFEPTYLNSPNVVKCFQKRFDDDKGKKYFITINKWDWTSFHRNDMVDYSYELETQIYKKNTHEPIDMTFFAGWNVDEVEEYMEKIWSPELFDYYEEWYE